MTACADPLDPSIAVALLAAGRGERFAGDKLSADLQARPLWRWAADAAERAGFATRLLIASEDNAASFAGTPWKLIVNLRANEGMGTSVACASEAARGNTRLVLILADMPFVEPTHLRALALGEGVMFTRYPDGHHGIPAAFPASAFARLRMLAGDRGASAQSWDEDVTTLAPVSATSLFDIDTAGDLGVAHTRLAAER